MYNFLLGFIVMYVYYREFPYISVTPRGSVSWSSDTGIVVVCLELCWEVSA